MEIGERIGRVDPRRVHKGCTTLYAREWITAVLQKKKRKQI
ncbi:hypothetical protein HMPREF9413_4221 [Paenibacillus sp. HGF7]|nr:hypothetical protein HMPREF9413_4221 [Paenibacillus sp. HGF7]